MLTFFNEGEGDSVMLPMADGVELSTYIDLPWGYKSGEVTMVMDRSPYGHFGLELIADIYIFFGLGAVKQDLRGTGLSQGSFELWHKAGSDGYTTMEWVSNQTWSDHKIFTVGASADGLASFAEALPSPPWLDAQFIIFASSVGYEVIYPGGADRLSLIEFWLDSTVPKQAPGLIQEIHEHEAPGQWWDVINMTTRYDAVTWPSVMWSGWYDIFQTGNLMAYDGYQHLAAEEARGQSKIVVDPLGHCQGAYKYFPKNLIFGRVALGVLLSLDLFLGKPAAEHANNVTFYVMGGIDGTGQGNYWTSLPEWPTYGQTNYYIHGNGSMMTTPQEARSNNPTSASYVHNPSNPVPTLGGNNLEIPCGPKDQSAAEQGARPDVLTFTTPPLAEDVWVTGPLTATLYVSSDAPDTDFMGRISEYYPSTGKSHLVQDGAVRMRWREYEQGPDPLRMEEGTVYEISMSLWNTSKVFTAGNSIRFSVASSNYKRFSVNPNNFCPLANVTCRPAQNATNTLHHSAEYPSRITLPTIAPTQVPPFSVLDAEVRYAEDILQAQPDAGAGVMRRVREDAAKRPGFHNGASRLRGSPPGSVMGLEGGASTHSDAEELVEWMRFRLGENMM